MYGRGEGWTNAAWKQFDRRQKRAASGHERASARLRSAAEVLNAGHEPRGADARTVRDVERVFGVGSATAERMLAAADRYDIAASILRDETTYFADGRRLNDFLNAGGENENQAAVVGTDRSRVQINLDHPDLWADALAIVLAHEPFHDQPIGLIDQLHNGVRAYRRGTQASQDAYRNLRQDPARALLNPDHLAAFMRGD